MFWFKHQQLAYLMYRDGCSYDIWLVTYHGDILSESCKNSKYMLAEGWEPAGLIVGGGFASSET